MDAQDLSHMSDFNLSYTAGNIQNHLPNFVLFKSISTVGACQRRCVTLVRSALYLPTAHPRAPSSPTDSPFRMSHRRASKHEIKSDRRSDTQSWGRSNNSNNWLTLSKVWGRHNEPSWLEHGVTCAATATASFVLTLRCVRRMFRGTGFVTPPIVSSPPLSSYPGWW